MSIGIRVKLIDDAKLVWKKWSVRFNALGLSLLAYLTLAPDAITHAWLMLPDEIKAFVPVKYSLYIPIVLFVLGLISNYIKQQKLIEEREKLAVQNGNV